MNRAYCLAEVKQLIEQKLYRTTNRAKREAFSEYGYLPEDIADTILELDGTDFHQTIISDQTGIQNDVYLKKYTVRFMAVLFKLISR